MCVVSSLTPPGSGRKGACFRLFVMFSRMLVEEVNCRHPHGLINHTAPPLHQRRSEMLHFRTDGPDGKHFPNCFFYQDCWCLVWGWSQWRCGCYGYLFVGRRQWDVSRWVQVVPQRPDLLSVPAVHSLHHRRPDEVMIETLIVIRE